MLRTSGRKTVRNQKEIQAMIDIPMGAAWGLCGQHVTHELLPGTIDGSILGCKALVAETREDK
jgi:hypothetical protein